MKTYWTIRKIGTREVTKNNFKVLSSKKYYTIKQIEDMYKGWVVINVETGKEVKKG